MLAILDVLMCSSFRSIILLWMLSPIFGKILPGQSHTFWEASVGDLGRSSGVCISVGARWLSHVVDHGALIPERSMWSQLWSTAFHTSL